MSGRSAENAFELRNHTEKKMMEVQAMSQFRCFNCGKIKPMDEVQNCSNCGAMLCRNCASQLENRCPKCDADVY